MNKHIAYKTLRYFADGLIPKHYSRRIIQWLTNEDDADIKDEALQKVWSETPEWCEGEDNELLLSRFHLSCAQYDRRNTLNTVYKRVLKYAAIVLFPLLMCVATWYFTALYNTQHNTLVECYVGNGTTKNIRLADGTMVRLNAGSTLFYPKTFGWLAAQREVYLDGEAHFDVEENAKQPFVVHIGSLKVKVLGTHFNVKAYPAEELITTTLEQGKVQICKEKQAITLLPNQQMVYNRMSGKMTKRNVNSEKYKTWMNGEMYFDQTPLKYIIADLQRRYNIVIKTTPSVDLTKKFTMAFKANENIEDVMRVLVKISGNLKYIYNQQHTMMLDTKKGGKTTKPYSVKQTHKTFAVH